MADRNSSTKRNGDGDGDGDDRSGNRKKIHITPQDFVIEPIDDDLHDFAKINGKYHSDHRH